MTIGDKTRDPRRVGFVPLEFFIAKAVEVGEQSEQKSTGEKDSI